MIRNSAGTAKGSAASAVRRNSEPENLKITDAELLAIYFYCRLHQNRHRKTDIHDYAQRYLISWFPGLPTYAHFNARLNAMESAVVALVPMILQSADSQKSSKTVSELMTLTDSMPIMLCSGKRQGRVATELSDKGYCASKGLYYYGVKLHVLARRVEGGLPLVQMAGLTAASHNDLAVFKPVADQMAGQAVFADKAYADKPLNERLMELQDTFIRPSSLSRDSPNGKRTSTGLPTGCGRRRFHASGSLLSRSSIGLTKRRVCRMLLRSGLPAG